MKDGTHRNEEDEGDGKGEEGAVPAELDWVVVAGENAEGDGD